ncbi:DUF4238 domain-containing protein [Aeromonas hydrophila]|uniref:DUF4238 domain-containing protein n=1 Tax=Aeromonas hydrophila TaxID=644 RepID=UPI003D1D66AC
MNLFDIKKKHHFVMQNYLKLWKLGVNEGSSKQGVWAYSKERKTTHFFTDLDSTAQERYFYELHIDEDVFGLLYSRYGQYSECKEALQWLETLMHIHQYKEAKEYNHDKLKSININILEEIYAKQESKVSRILQSIDGDLDIFIDNIINHRESPTSLAYIFFFQLFRTKSYRNSLDTHLNKLSISWSDGQSREFSLQQKENYLKASAYLETMVSTTRLITSGFSIEFLENNNHKKFITSDTPSIFIDGLNHQISTMVGYMPLTPNLAMLVRGNSIRKIAIFRKNISQDIVMSYNKHMKNSNSSYLYSTSKHF